MGLVNLKELLTNEEGKLLKEREMEKKKAVLEIFKAIADAIREGDIAWNTHAYLVHKLLLYTIGAGEDITEENIEKSCACIAHLIADVDDEEVERLGSVPSGHLYANVSGVLTLNNYTDIISLLEKGGFVKVEDHLITWIK